MQNNLCFIFFWKKIMVGLCNVELNGVLNWGVLGVELTDVWNWEIF